MKALKNKSTAVIITVLLAVIAISVFGGGDLRALRNETLTYFNEGDGSALVLGVPYDINKRIEHAGNLMAFAKKYMGENNSYITAIKEAAENLAKAQTPEKIYKANEELGKKCEELNTEFYSNYTLNDSDKKYNNREYFLSDLEADNDRMEDSANLYNTKAAEFNALIAKFPTNIVKIVSGVSKLTLFSE